MTTDRERAERGGRGVRSQTLERALDALQVLADGTRRTSQEIADALGLHRSIVYRILRTLEDYSLVARAPDGRYALGLGLPALASAALIHVEVQIDEVLQELADATSATALFCGSQHDDAVVLASARPTTRPTSVAVRTGTRFPLRSGAPGQAILALGAAREAEPDEVSLARQTGLVRSKGEPFGGLEALAVPVTMPDGQAASLAVLFPVGEAGRTEIEQPLRYANLRLTKPGEVWTGSP